MCISANKLISRLNIRLDEVKEENSELENR